MIDSLIFATSAVMPIILTVAIGYLLKKAGFMSEDFSKAANKLVFRIFLPAMLFLNIYGINDLASYDFGYVIYAFCTVLLIFLIGIPTVCLVTDKGERRGSLLQSIFRSNYALIGIPLASMLFPSEGAAVATLLSAVMVPVFNILGVISLSIFGNGDGKGGLKKVLMGILKNPLILGIVSGLFVLGIRAIFVNLNISFRLSEITPVFTVLKYLSNMATPLALLVLGAQFEFSAVKELKREIIFGTLTRSVIVPLLGLGVAYIFFGKVFGGAQFAALVAVFSTPVAVSSVPMAQEMGADTTLSGQIVIFTTLVSAITVFSASFILKLLGVF